MYPGRSVWARGVLALGATTLLFLLLLLCRRCTGDLLRQPSTTATSYRSTRVPEVVAETARKIQSVFNVPQEFTDHTGSHVLQKRNANYDTNTRMKHFAYRYKSHGNTEAKRWPVKMHENERIRSSGGFGNIDENKIAPRTRKISDDFVEQRKKYTRYYTSRSMNKPTAYVHIQPAMTQPPAHGKCVRCMIVYKPCPQPPKIILSPNKYRAPAQTWRGLKYGEFMNFLLSTMGARIVGTTHP